MRKRILQSSLAFVLCGLVMTGNAWAQGRGHGRGVSGNQAWRADNDGDHGRWASGNNQTPRGWEKGKKTGWGDCDVPPGQAKKSGCAPSSRVLNSRTHHSYVDHDRDGDRDHNRFRRTASHHRHRDRRDRR